MPCRDQPPCRRGIAPPGLRVSLSLLVLTLTPSLLHAASQSRPVFGEERFDRAGGNPDHYERTFSVPAYVAAPFTLHLINGNPDGSARVAVEDAVASGRVLVDDVEVIAPSAFSKTVATLDRSLTLAPGPHTLTVELASAPGSYLRLTITGTIALGDLTLPRAGHTATLLPDGRVLVTGGWSGSEPLSTTERFDGGTLQSAALDLQFLTARRNHRVTLLPDATFLVTGGADAVGPLATAEHLRRELSAADPLPAGLHNARAGHSATLLPDGRVLLLGGLDVSNFALTEGETFDARPDPLAVSGAGALYDPQTGAFTPLPDALQVPRTEHTATLLPSGLVLVTGGRNGDGDLATAELFDPATGHSTRLPAMLTTPRSGHAATLQPDGSVLLIGGRQGGTFLGSLEVFRPATQTFVPATATLLVPRAAHTATRLPNGEVLVAGGESTGGVLAHTELVGPPAPDPTPPQVLALSPAAGATLVPRNPLVTVLVSEPLLVTTVTSATVTLTGPGGPVPGLVAPAEDGLLVVFTPSVRLEPGTTYTLTLSGLTDIAGNLLPTTTSQFTTFPAPVLTGFSPPSGPPGSAVTITGTGFAVPTPAQVRVAFNGVSAVVTGVTATSLTALVPETAETGLITVTTPGGTAVSAAPFTILRPPTITDFSPTTGVVGTNVTVSGTNFVGVQTVAIGGVAASFSVANAGTLTATVPAGARSGPLTVTTPQGTAVSAQSFTVLDSAPVLTPIGSRTIPLGTTLSLTVSAMDPDGDPVSFAVTPLPLPTHATFNSQTGQFVFTPDATQVGTFTLTFTASDGARASSETVALTVTGAPAGGTTGVAGRIVDGGGLPLANVAVTLKATGQRTMTDAQGLFTLTGVPSGRQQLVVDGFAQGYAILVAPVDLIVNVTTQVATPLTIPPIDQAHAVPVTPSATTVVTNPSLPGVVLTIPAGTAKNADGSLYSGSLSISPVPEYGRPESRPVELRPGLSITIQPAGVVLDPPAPLTFPNVDNLAPGNDLDLWSLSPDTGTFLQVGTMRVSADGTKIETISGGVRKTAWHFPLPPSPTVAGGSRGRTGGCTTCQLASAADLEEGALSLDEIIPGIRSLGVSRDMSLHYRSTTADVRPILPIDASLSPRVLGAPLQTFSARLTIGSVQQGDEVYWNAGLPGSVSRLGVQFDASSLVTGRYPYELMLFANYTQSSIGGAMNDRVLIRNERASAFGAGWTLAGMDRLIPQADGTVVLAQSDGSTEVFGQSRPLVIESFSGTRSVTINGISMSFVTGGVYGQARTDLLNPANFGPTGIVPRSVTFRTGIDTITTAALDGVDIFVINRPLSELTGSEGAALDQFVQGGGAVLEMRPFGFNRQQFLGTVGGTQISAVNAVLTSDGLNSALAQGPFGSVSSPFPTGSSSYYTVTGAGIILATNTSGPTLLQLPSETVFTGQGRAVLFGDSETWASGYQGGGTNLYTAGTNRTLFLNTIAFLAGTPGYMPPPPPPGTGSTYVGPPGDFSTLVKNTDGTFTRTLKDGTQYQFNTQGLQTAVTDRNGNTTTYGYDGSGNLTTITNPAGQVTTLAYNGSVVSAVTDPAGRVTQFEHDGDGNLTALAYADGSRMTFTYDPQHRLIQRTDARNQVTRYQYDYAGRFTQATLPTGEVRTLTPTQQAAVPNLAAGEGTRDHPAALAATNPSASFQDGNGHTSTFTLDGLGRVTTQTDALGRVTTIERDAQGNPTKLTRPNGAVTTLTYDAKGNLLTTTEAAISATTMFTYEPVFNQVTSITDPKGNRTTITYDAKGNPTQITDAAGNKTTLTYNSRGLLTSTKDALNQTTSFTYDSLGRLLMTTDPLGRTTTLTYDAAGNVATSTDALNRVTQFQYDAKTRLTQVTDPAGGVTRDTYDGTGNLLTVTDAKGQVTTFTYDARNRLASTTDPLGHVETYTYDGADNLLTRVTPKGDTISFAYDAVNQLLTKTLPGSQVTTYTYDSAGNLTGVTDPDSMLAMTYDLANRVTAVSTAGSSNQPPVALDYVLDPNGNRVAVGSPAGLTSYSYDALNRLTTLTFPPLTAPTCPAAPPAVGWWPGEGTPIDVAAGHLGVLQNGTSFAPGQIGQAFLFDGVDDLVNIFATDDLNLTTAVTIEAWVYPTASGGPIRVLAGRPFGYQLDMLPDRHVRFAFPQGGTVNRFVDSVNLLPLNTWTHVVGLYNAATGAIQVYLNGVLEQTATATGAIDSQSKPFQIGGFADPGFTGGFFAGRIDEVHLYARALSAAEVQARTCVEPPAPPSPTMQYAYDALSRRTSVTLPNGTQTSYTYDPASQLSAVSHQLAAIGQQINQAAYVYNAVGNRTSLTDRRGTQAFGYDPLDRLTSATHPLLLDPQSFAYDPVGNRTTNASLYNTGNQLTEDAGFVYEYDANGNLIRKTGKGTGNHTDYTYDAENRLVEVNEFAAGATEPVATSSYRYDGLGRRIEKVGNGQTRRYVYDGEDILLEYDGSNALLARYTHGPGIDEPLAMTRGENTYFYHQDGLGTVTDLTDASGNTAQSYAYDAWGNLIEQTGSVENPYTYTGREFDSETGLYYYRARYYDPKSGRFLQKDPIRNLNAYSYVLNNPVALKDPTGLDVLFFGLQASAFLGPLGQIGSGIGKEVTIGLAFDTASKEFQFFSSTGVADPTNPSDQVSGFNIGLGPTFGVLKGCLQDFLGEANEKTTTLFVAGFTEIMTSGKKGFSFAPPGTGLGYSYTNISTYTSPIGRRF